MWVHSRAFVDDLEWCWMMTGGVCIYCNLPRRRGHQPTIEHIIPRSLGGYNHILNKLPACKRCNNKRGVKMPCSGFVHPVWRELVKERERLMLTHSRKPKISANEQTVTTSTP